jgi:site-specific DNA-methyltransferase (cytosine-N4-specific)
MPRSEPLYRTPLGAAYVGDALDLLGTVPDGTVDLVITSPPYALHFKKEYGNPDKGCYQEWFLPFAAEVRRVLKDSGSFVLNIGGSYEGGAPVRSLYQFRLLIRLVDDLDFHLAQEFFWFNPAKLPAPAEWVNVRRIRVKDSVEYIWWLAKEEWPCADNREVLAEYSADMRRLIRKGVKTARRPSGHNITRKFSRDHGGSIPSNLIISGNNESNSHYIQRCRETGVQPHPARFPASLPAFFIKFLAPPDGLVLDIFAGSNTTGAVAERLGRRWLAFELDRGYLESSRFRFEESPAPPEPSGLLWKEA